MRKLSVVLFSALTRAALPDFEIREWHFHPYFFQEKPESLKNDFGPVIFLLFLNISGFDQKIVIEGRELYNKVISEIEAGKFIAVVDGVQDYFDSIGLPISPESFIGRFSEEPAGPHPMGQFGLWVPSEYFGPVWSFMTENRGNLTVLLQKSGLI